MRYNVTIFEIAGVLRMAATREHNMFNPKMEAMDRHERRALQSERLRKVVKVVYDHVPVSRARMDKRRASSPRTYGASTI